MKRRMSLVVAAVLATALSVGIAGTVMAETATPPNDWWQQMSQLCNANGGMAGGYLSPGIATQVAKVLGISTQDLAKERAAGKSYVQIAAAKNITEQQLLDAALALHMDTLQLRLKYGLLTEQQVDELVTQQTERLREALNSTATTSNRPGGFGGMMGGNGGQGGMIGGNTGQGGMMGGSFGGTMGGASGMMRGWY